MRDTDFDDLLEPKGTAVSTPGTVPYQVKGQPIGASDIKPRMADFQYKTLSRSDDTNIIRASERACVHLGAVFARLGQALDLDNPVHREVTCLWTIYELHLALGHEEAGREWRIKAKDLIIASLGAYPESGQPQEGSPAIGAIAVPRPRRYAPYESRST